jgi:hypothetical protein
MCPTLALDGSYIRANQGKTRSTNRNDCMGENDN